MGDVGQAGLVIALELDHVLIAAADLATAAHELEARHDLTVGEGGRHPGWGTANRIVPLGEAYLELVGVVDEAEAAQSSFGRWVAGGRRPGLGRPLGWAVRTRELDRVAGRLGLEVRTGSRVAGGELLRWRSAGIEQAAAEPSLPFFIEWGPGTPFPGRTVEARGAGSLRILRLELEGDAERLAAWLGEHELPIAVRPGPPAVARIVLAGTGGEIVVEGGRP